jgi:hypothetical protein
MKPEFEKKRGMKKIIWKRRFRKNLKKTRGVKREKASRVKIPPNPVLL